MGAKHICGLECERDCCEFEGHDINSEGFCNKCEKDCTGDIEDVAYDKLPEKWEK